MEALWGCQSRNLSPPPLDPDPMERSGYVVGVEDVLQISVWRNEELSVVVPVRSDGKISVPLVDDVQAEGLQAMEIKEVLTRGAFRIHHGARRHRGRARNEQQIRET